MKRPWLSLALKRAITAAPCVICGVPYDLKVDHIKSVAMGGTNELDNLQSLCHGCNHIKGSRLNNAQVKARLRLIGLEHFLRAVCREDTRYENSFDRRGVRTWRADQPHRAAYAEALYRAFMERSAE